MASFARRWRLLDASLLYLRTSRHFSSLLGSSGTYLRASRPTMDNSCAIFGSRHNPRTGASVMHLQIECPACKSGLNVSLNSVGTWTNCRYCTAQLKIPPPGMNVSDWSPGQASIPVTDDHVVPNAIRQPPFRLFSGIRLELTRVCSAITSAFSPSLTRAGYACARRICHTHTQQVH